MVTEPEPGFVPLSERLDAVWLHLGRLELAETSREKSDALAKLRDTISEAIETLQDVEGRK